ncbi:MAG: F0F1 ATP synthase subunit alpha, partial [Clostridia bacterium]|nr:F0F1 ATP synthase subunit alpha [Clostridia bacterium]
GRNSPVRVGCQVAIVYAVINGYLNDIPVKQVKSYEALLYELLENKYNGFLTRVEAGSWSDEDISELCTALNELKR